MSKLVPPHGSKELKILALEGDDLQIEQKKSSSLTQVICSSREFGDVIMFEIGRASCRERV